MLAEEYNVKYNTILSSFSQLRLFRANNVRWGMKGDTYMNDSMRLFLYLRTLNRYSPGINLCDSDLNVLFKNALTLSSGFRFLKIEGDISRIQPIDMCGCKCGQTVVNIINNITTGGGINEDKLFFTTTDESPTLTLDNYHTTYFLLYGNSPKLKLYDNNGVRFIADLETPERIEYQDNDPNKDILRIVWQFPYGVSGYVQIVGSATGSGGSGGVTPGILTYSEANLLEHSPGDGNWYLPLVLAANKRPYFTLVNNVETKTRYDKSFTPSRLYGFSSNSAQTIQISVI